MGSGWNSVLFTTYTGSNLEPADCLQGLDERISKLVGDISAYVVVLGPS